MTTIQISRVTKLDLDAVRKRENLRTYEDTLQFLLAEQKKNIPSLFGCLKGTPPFEREREEDPYRVPS